MTGHIGEGRRVPPKWRSAVSFCCRCGAPWLVLASLGVAWPEGAAARGGAMELPILTLPAGSRTHDLPAGMQLNGVRLAARLLDIALPIEQAVPALAAQFPAPPAILRDGNQVILATVGTPWLLALGAREGRTLGTLSMLSAQTVGVAGTPMAGTPAAGTARARAPVAGLPLPGVPATETPAAGTPAAGYTSRAAPGWLPSGVEKRFELSTRDVAGHGAQQVFTHPWLTPPQLARQVFAGLVREGWTPAQAPRTAASVWRRGGAQLMLSIVPAGRASGLLAITTVADGRPAAAMPALSDHD